MAQRRIVIPHQVTKRIAQVGQPMPTYNTVLLRVTPHVVMVRKLQRRCALVLCV